MKGLIKRHIYIGCLIVLIAAFHLLTQSKPVMTAVSNTALVIKQFISGICAVLPLSVGELLVILAICTALFFIVFCIVRIVKAEKKWPVIYRLFTLALSVVLTLYFLFCVLLNASYYADSFRDKSGIEVSKSSVDELYDTMSFFVAKVKETASSVSRDDNGLFNVAYKELIKESVGIYDGAEALFPFLKMKDRPPKPVLFSRLMSRFNYTGFYFPYTGEANINIDVVPCMIPATIAHEMAHQRGIASEQEANFVALLACSESGNADYEYSGWLFGFIHLGNALYKYDKDRYFELAALLPEEAKVDIRANNDYWARFDTPEAKVTEKVYDAFLKGNGQELGVQSYGAVVDLIIAWYKSGGFKQTGL